MGKIEGVLIKHTFLILISLFLLTRIVNLTAYPIFNDEATYIRYGLHQLKEADHKPYSLLIGKEPLLPLFYALSGTLTGDLIAGARLVTVAFGLATLWCLYQYVSMLKDKKTAFVACLLFILNPYTIFFDRLALLDGPMNVISISTLLLTALLIKSGSLKYAVLLGITIGAGLWIKSTGLFYLILPVFAFGWYFLTEKSSYKTKMKMGKNFAIAVVMAFLIFIPLYLHPFYKELQTQIRQFTHPLSFVFTLPVSTWMTNLSKILSWLGSYLTIPIFVLFLAGIVHVRESFERKLLILWFCLPFLYMTLYADNFTSRHTLVLTLPIIIIASLTLSRILELRKKLGYLVLGVAVTVCLVYDFAILFSPEKIVSMHFGQAREDLKQYFYGFSSGYGVHKAIDFVKSKAGGRPTVVLIRADHGSPEDAVWAYLGYDKNIKVVEFTNPYDVQNILMPQVRNLNLPLYFISRDIQYNGIDHLFLSAQKFPKLDHEFVGVMRMNQ